MCESPIASSFNDLISPKLFYVFENTTDTVGIATVLVYGLACKDLLYPAKSARAQHFWPWVPCHRVHFACGQSQLKQISVPAWSKAGVESASISSRQAPPPSSSGQAPPAHYRRSSCLGQSWVASSEQHLLHLHKQPVQRELKGSSLGSEKRPKCS